ncbi:hypothetical protein [Nocardia sp. alder85J]|uniref:hypothetical protein n=1 Tax=Nocardia sp. alder85J TaxID=2862949 RepID=UPI0022569AD5|nr:hypothetical protein [Nocardia sp. alder85J]MCX4098389.1 hypothetical protein [Nocardia sp. alder85J]
MRRVVHLHDSGVTAAAIAEVLNADRVPTPAGRPHWTRAHVFRLVRTAAADIRREPLRPDGDARLRGIPAPGGRWWHQASLSVSTANRC